MVAEHAPRDEVVAVEASDEDVRAHQPVSFDICPIHEAAAVERAEHVSDHAVVRVNLAVLNCVRSLTTGYRAADANFAQEFHQRSRRLHKSVRLLAVRAPTVVFCCILVAFEAK